MKELPKHVSPLRADAPVIEKNIKIPKARLHTGQPRKYPWAEMEIGDSFLITEKRVLKQIGTVARQFSRAHPNYIFVIRYLPEGTRVWRVAEPPKEKRIKEPDRVAIDRWEQTRMPIHEDVVPLHVTSLKAGPCAGKIVFSSQEHAMARARETDKGEVYRGQLSAYWCEAHHGWHMGHSSRSPKSLSSLEAR
jgi:hypothetical protein